MGTEKKSKTGRPSAYDPAYCEQARKLCLLSATDKELADFFGVSEVTLNAWKKAHPEFLKALKAGKAQADAEVADRLYDRAMGYTHSAVKIFADPKTGAEKIVEYTEQYPPDTTAAIFWLKNRRRGEWRDKHDVEHSGTVTLEQLVGASFDAKKDDGK